MQCVVNPYVKNSQTGVTSLFSFLLSLQLRVCMYF